MVAAAVPRGSMLVLQATDDFDEIYVRLAITPYPGLSSAEQTVDISNGLGRLNDRVLAVKFTLDEAGDWGLALDLPSGSLDAAGLEAGMRRLGGSAIAWQISRERWKRGVAKREECEGSRSGVEDSLPSLDQLASSLGRRHPSSVRARAVADSPGDDR